MLINSQDHVQSGMPKSGTRRQYVKRFKSKSYFVL